MTESEIQWAHNHIELSERIELYKKLNHEGKFEEPKEENESDEEKIYKFLKGKGDIIIPKEDKDSKEIEKLETIALALKREQKAHVR